MLRKNHLCSGRVPDGVFAPWKQLSYTAVGYVEPATISIASPEQRFNEDDVKHFNSTLVILPRRSPRLFQVIITLHARLPEEPVWRTLEGSTPCCIRGCLCFSCSLPSNRFLPALPAARVQHRLGRKIFGERVVLPRYHLDLPP